MVNWIIFKKMGGSLTRWLGYLDSLGVVIIVVEVLATYVWIEVFEDSVRILFPQPDV